MRVRAVLAVAVTGLLLAGCTSAPAALQEGVRTDDERLKAGDTVFLVQFTAETDLAGTDEMVDWNERGREVMRRLQATAESSQAEAKRAADQAGARYVSVWLSNSMVFVGQPELGAELTRLPGVAKVWQELLPTNEQMPAGPAPATTTSERTWHLDAMRVPAVWAQGYTGTGITIGVIDTGVELDHPEILAAYRGTKPDGSQAHEYNWWSPLRDYRAKPVDVGGHGTSTAGLAVGATVGVAPGARWIAGLACSSAGCPMSGVLQAMQFMMAPSKGDGSDPQPDLRPQIVNNSWVRDDYVEPMQRAARALSAAGIFQTFAVGNAGPKCGSASPMGDWPSFATIGSATQAGGVSRTSSRGPTHAGWQAPDAIAPGERVWASRSGGVYGFVSGTSFAAPQVAGVAALMMQANPALIGRPDVVAELLRHTARPVPDVECRDTDLFWPNDGAGYGLVNAESAVLEGCGPGRHSFGAPAWQACAKL